MPRPGTDDKGKVKFKIIEGRTIEFELDGFNSTIEESIKSIVTSLGRSSLAATPNRPMVQQARTISALPAAGNSSVIEHEANGVQIVSEAEPLDEANIETEPVAKSNKGVKATYKPPLPDYLHDLNMEGNGVSFKDFAAAKPTKAHTVRFLIAASWLKEHGGSPTVTTNKIYTCYKTVGWPLNITDWDSNLRKQVQTDRFRRINPGEYAITPLGESDLQELDGTA